MEVKRVNHYLDDRFNEEVLSQHGAFLIDNQPYSVHIINGHTARVLGKEANHFPALIEAFRFYAEPIDTFIDLNDKIIKQYPPQKLFQLELR
ncbi:hypothetical protein [Facklamia sp. P12934]|uniref:hypothetical protein n=1 Tax=unclassified Facklamia TaxID=2622293 RepID=UPI003D1808BA